ncbi:VirB4 family type IV secretion system protein [Paenibacillus woosongensis]|uniref:Helicase HerA central domain-containing protein n=1 Tax=Paenibacillus woosongensis TaxID=307580 RepID=A0ABQ4MZ03_9BACL|nr:DUF87 domain-containing protein [Paenibacillus woosongensis]GIP61139.1 hypothetical protein J15TS10_49530 [Paenibacillus woosongensis]
MLVHTKRLIKNYKNESKEVVVNIASGTDNKTGQYVRVLAVKGYPPMILTGYLDELDQVVGKAGATLRKTIRYAASNVKFNFSMKNKLKRLQLSINEANETDPARQEEVDARDTIIALRDSTISADRKLLEVTTFLTISASKKHQLESAEANLKIWFDNVSGSLDDLKNEQLEALRQTAPAADHSIPASSFFEKHHYGRVTLDNVAARTYPFTRGSFSDDYGLYFGRRTEDGGFCFINLCDPNDPRAKNITVFGKTGEGKSYFMKALVVSLLEEGVHVFVFDLDGEWEELCKEVGGVYIDHTADEGRYFEPLTILPPIPELDNDCIKYNRTRYRQARKSGIRTISLLADGLTKVEKFEAGEAIKQVYKDAGIERSKPSTWNNPTGPRPTIHRVFEVIQKNAETNADAKSLYNKIKIYFIGVENDMFKVEESITFQNAPLVVYKVGQGAADGEQESEETKQAQIKMSMAFDIVNANIQKLKFEGNYFSAVLVDEGQRQTRNPELRRAIFDWYTAIRKWNGMMILGSNTPAIMLDTSEGEGMWENTSVRVYFYMEHSAIRKLSEHSYVPIEIQERIAENEGSNCYILEYHKKYDELIMQVPPEEDRLYKTRGLKKKAG